MHTQRQWRMWWTFTVLALAGFGVPSPTQEPKKGLNVGDLVPISSMRCVVGEPKDRNTCLAGKYRDKRTISIYVRSLEEPHLNSLLQKVNALMEDKQELRGYVLVLEGSQFDNAFKDKLRDWAKAQKFTKLDVAISNGNASVGYGIDKKVGVVVVYSEKLRVKYHQAFEVGKLDVPTVKELAGKLQALAR